MKLFYIIEVFTFSKSLLDILRFGDYVILEEIYAYNKEEAEEYAYDLGYTDPRYIVIESF